MEPAYVLAPLGVFFLCCQLILCRIARFCSWSKSNHWLFAYVVEAGDFLPNVLGSMAMGSIPEEPSAVVLMLYLIVLNNSVAAYDREKVQLRYIWTGINVISSAYRALNVVAHAKLGSTAKYVGAYAIVAIVLCSYAYCNCFILLASASKHYSEAVVDEHMSRTEDQFNPSTLEGYGYVVLLEPETTTVDRILSPETAEGEGEQQGHKDLCLSFSLFQLLFCLYHGVPWYQEASRQRCRELVLEELLGGSPRRGFRVVEVELAFLHDHIYGGDILWYPGSGRCRAVYYFLKTAMAVAMYIVGLILYLKSDQPRVWVIAPPMLLYLLFDLLQVVFYCRSDRRVVSRMCHCQQYFGWFISFIRWPKLSRNPSEFYRLECVGQYSLLEETTPPRDNNSSRSIPYPQTSLYSHNAKPSGPAVPLPASLKLRVAEVLGDTICQVPVPPQVEAAQRFRGAEPNQKIATILKWHIATSYCEMNLQADNYGSPSREVAVVLSKYCSYLVAFCPELLPCSVSVTMRTFRDVLDAVRSLVGGMQGWDKRLLMLWNRAQESPAQSDDDILNPGLHLGDQLITRIPDRQLLWEILESIWVKLILSVAPQESTHDDTYAKRHAKYLAQGGEFVTYLWALLSHAGIQKHSSWPPCIRDERVVSWVNP